MAQLSFKASKTLAAIAKHTLEATKYSNPYSLYPEMESILHLDLVKDDGIYIMSGSNTNYKEGKGAGSTVVYAFGFNPKTNNECDDDSRRAVGGDDFVEPIEITKDQLQRVANGGKLVISLSEDSIGVSA